MERIAIFVKNLTSGGAEKQAVLQAKALSKNKQVYFIVFNGKKVHEKYLDMLDGTEVTTKMFVGNHLKRFVLLCQFLKKEKIAIVFSYLTAANLYACLAGLIVGNKIVTGLRNAYYTPEKRYVNLILTNFFAQRTVVNCYSGFQAFLQSGFKKTKMVVIPNCMENINPLQKKSYGGKIISVGRFTQQKDYATALKAVAELYHRGCECEYNIVGYGPMEEDIRKWISNYGLDPIVHVYINPNNIAELLNNADIYLSTSLYEGTSNSIMEAMNANLPIVATNVGDNSCLVHEGVNGFLVPPKDTKAICCSLEKLLGNSELMSQYGAHSKRILQEDYSKELFTQRYLNLISELEKA